MRLTVIALALLPGAAFAQSVTLPSDTVTAQSGQSCPAGTVMSGSACVTPEQAVTPAQSFGGGHDCSSRTKTDAVSS
ncbi:hypothetical protein [Yoonia sediminilitoris]|uniref:Silver efflux pump n=1 Tax=Yoonia sediminilitoris TaxID=1286148 RepID=A0A2T6KBH5_9RHOB|nr:hypothetical protein [Yoonia sediminilitoris]PUB12173.1 hypothetical protein C8N45_111150 [Yoonia sediminilitoris]RCW93000.1 hypothetical protein DFP92_111149 [Yoonia sediminilitoris]